jgi:hypothetical protein
MSQGYARLGRNKVNDLALGRALNGMEIQEDQGGCSGLFPLEATFFDVEHACADLHVEIVQKIAPPAEITLAVAAIDICVFLSVVGDV